MHPRVFRNSRSGLLVLSTFILVSFGGCTAKINPGMVKSGNLVAPAGFIQVQENSSGPIECAELPEPYTDSLDMRSKYEGSDKSRANLNKAALKAYKKSTDEVREFEKRSIDLSEKLLEGRPGAAVCLTRLLDDWAQADALMSEDVNHIGEAVRKWALACASLAYLKLDRVAHNEVSEEQRQSIETWLYGLSGKVRQYYTDRPLKKVNNHDYWAGWAVMATGVALRNQELFDWAVTKYREAAGQIDASGYLPNELRRQQRALEYHNFALQPLVMMAVFAEANGLHLAAENQNALERLARRVADGLNSPKSFELLTGREQLVDGLLNPWSVAWTEPYAATFGQSALNNMPTLPSEHLKSSRLGGDLTRMFQPSKEKAGAESDL
ncbi:hypothetical protein BTA51_04650 [Hahella sp. CCB-MM4]|uniref:mannuronate-specific alginate lyase n=1 Tax=Hahella sp. (strain CCB-MM4) TaxID=1926491 RepID=UPI000B9B0607|nr:mannuronate-specific alginate lyase [Hahella sp. CCB-MM4]OZG74307.1 hypothetical protein BTA51_04650 [Hahella sp. CCB-MM4]